MTDEQRYPGIKLVPCADWFHRWNINGYCDRCGMKLTKVKADSRKRLEDSDVEGR